MKKWICLMVLEAKKSKGMEQTGDQCRDLHSIVAWQKASNREATGILGCVSIYYRSTNATMGTQFS